MAQCCGTCKWFEEQNEACAFPLPEWLMNHLRNELTGGGWAIPIVRRSQGSHCPCYEDKRP